MAIYVEDWHKCGIMCENHHALPKDECKFWTFLRNSQSGWGYCYLFKTNEGKHIDNRGVSGPKGCK